jgi:hypothetical protein
MISIKHNKFRNTGILFELLIRQITADTMSQKDSKAVNIIKKYFVNTELAKENKLYQSISKSHNLTESKAEVIISTVLEANKSLNKEKLLKEDISLIAMRKEIGLYDNYSSKTSLQAQIAMRYGDGVHFLIPNVLGLGVGKSKKKYCLLNEFVEKKLDISALDLEHVYSELSYFIKQPIIKNIFEF